MLALNLTYAPPLGQVEIALAALREAKAHLDAINNELLRFIQAHGIEQIDSLDQIIQMRGDNAAARQRIAPGWADLQRRKGIALHRFSAAEKTWSDAVMRATGKL